MKKYLFKNSFLIVIIVVAILFRFTGINPGYPRHSDEGGYSSAITMIWNKNLDPKRYDYPAGVPTIHYFLFKNLFTPLGWINYFYQNIDKFVDGYLNLPKTEQELNLVSKFIWGDKELNIMYWGRYITAFFGVGVVIVTYFLAKLLYGKSVGLVSAFLVAVNYRQVLNSHIGLPDIYNSFFLILSLLFSLRILYTGKLKYYILAGISGGWYFSIKFQFFNILPLIWAHLSKFGVKIYEYRKLLISFLVFGLIFIIINPYLFINFESFIAIQKYQFLKYGAGINSLYLYPYWYLYNFGMGKALSFFAAFGFLVALLKYPKKSLIIILPLLQSLYTFTYLSRGGFYTRNFVTIIPLLLILSSLFIVISTKKLINKVNVASFLILIIVILVSYKNIIYSFGVVAEYQKLWNVNQLIEWEKNNLPRGARVAAHPDTPLEGVDVVRLPYETNESFSIEEFIKSNSDFAISNSSWSTNDFYWWISSDSKSFLSHFWVKPSQIMEYSYSAIALRELEQFSLVSFEKKWFAPDVLFVVAKIPKYKVLTKEKLITYDFIKNNDFFVKNGNYWTDGNNLDRNKDGLMIRQLPFNLASVRWESIPIDISDINDLLIEYEIKSDSIKPDSKAGYIFLSFYENEKDALASKNRIWVGLSERNLADGQWKKEKLLSIVPPKAKYLRISFSSYDPQNSTSYLKSINLNQADMDIDFNGYNPVPVKTDQNNLFPNSHGNL